LKEDEDEDRGTKEMQTKDLTDILSAIDMAAGKLRDIDPHFERSSTVKRAQEPRYALIMKSCKKKSQQLTLYSFSIYFEPRPGPSSAK
jgi:hypothetical protein